MSATQSTGTAPVVPLRGGAVFPGKVQEIAIGRKQSYNAARVAFEESLPILVLVQYDGSIEHPDADDLTPVGILATVLALNETQQHGTQMRVRLERRVLFDSLVQTTPYLTGQYSPLPEDTRAPDDLMAEAIAYVEEYAHMLGEVNRRLLSNLRSYRTAGNLADYIAGLLSMPLENEIDLLVEADGVARLVLIVEYLEQEIRIADVRNKIQQEARAGADKAQQDFMLREQMKAIQRELGEDTVSFVEELRNKIADLPLPELVRERAGKELARLERAGDHSAESGVIRTYLEWLTELPWGIATEDNLDIDHVRAILDEDHYGLDDVKDRIVEYVAVRKLAGNAMKGAIINLNGPPGVGKTSIATSVARAIGREVVRISLGGVRDEAEIRGHRRTYIGAIPGRIIRSLRDVKTSNPVIVLDEIDKVGSDWRGDPSAALLEVLDPEQNHSFTDHYLEVPYDLSQVIFITTSNTTRTIPLPLYDRMESITMPGYIEDEKVQIAQNYLIRKQAGGHGVATTDINFSEAAIRKLIHNYTYEAGVRQLERQIGTLIRKIAVSVARGESGPFTIDEAYILDQLGPEKVSYGVAEEEDEIGVVTGLAVSANGGDLTKIEVSLSEGNGRLVLTGSLGDVMKESAQAALTYARANARTLDLNPAVFDKTNIHIHFPAGATPKDGPSAGIGVTTALISAFTQRPVRKDVAMTGEVTLRGKVLEIGGLKQKTIAAHRSGIMTVIIPQANVKQIPDLPEQIRAEVTIIPVEHIEAVLDVALLAATGEPWGGHLPHAEDETRVPSAPPLTDSSAERRPAA
ncbi:MAG: endopeptidase La [Anaerolineae bacterium]|nr:endopeptidase La [Anaerolineae bacterium]